VFKGSISTVLDIAPGHARGEALARLFLAARLGLAVPVLGLGVATQAFSTPTALPGSPRCWPRSSGWSPGTCWRTARPSA